MKRILILFFVALGFASFGQINYLQDSVSNIDYRTTWGKPVLRYWVVECDTSDCETFKLEVRRNDTTQMQDYISRELTRFGWYHKNDSTLLSDMVNAYNNIVKEMAQVDKRMRKQYWYIQRLKAIQKQIRQ